ncbi:hypothetical protein, partial [Mesorhizobium sp.]|uniref:hypothetical protein n=1 Tax=Mesorhizobium sp. TaxID=1871066 RepID=UPI0025BD9845
MKKLARSSDAGRRRKSKPLKSEFFESSGVSFRMLLHAAWMVTVEYARPGLDQRPTIGGSAQIRDRIALLEAELISASASKGK